MYTDVTGICFGLQKSIYLLLGALGLVSKEGKVSMVDSQKDKMVNHRSFQDIPEPQRYNHLFLKT